MWCFLSILLSIIASVAGSSDPKESNWEQYILGGPPHNNAAPAILFIFSSYFFWNNLFSFFSRYFSLNVSAQHFWRSMSYERIIVLFVCYIQNQHYIRHASLASAFIIHPDAREKIFFQMFLLLWFSSSLVFKSRPICSPMFTVHCCWCVAWRCLHQKATNNKIVNIKRTRNHKIWKLKWMVRNRTNIFKYISPK